MGSLSLTHLIILLCLIPLYLLPSIIAYHKNHKHKIPIILINILGGGVWGVGWLIALVWCFIEPKKNAVTSSAEEISKLFELKEKGVISQEEFERKKKDLLD